MKSSLKVSLLILPVFFILDPALKAAIMDVNQIWTTYSGSSESIICVAHCMPDAPSVPESLIFSSVPEPIMDSSTYGDWTNWQFVLCGGQKIVYMYGPRNENGPADNVPWFQCTLVFQWDEVDVVDVPVYIDAALLDGDFGVDSFDDVFWNRTRGTWSDAWYSP